MSPSSTPDSLVPDVVKAIVRALYLPLDTPLEYVLTRRLKRLAKMMLKSDSRSLCILRSAVGAAGKVPSPQDLQTFCEKIQPQPLAVLSFLGFVALVWESKSVFHILKPSFSLNATMNPDKNVEWRRIVVTALQVLHDLLGDLVEGVHCRCFDQMPEGKQKGGMDVDENSDGDVGSADLSSDLGSDDKRALQQSKSNSLERYCLPSALTSWEDKGASISIRKLLKLVYPLPHEDAAQLIEVKEIPDSIFEKYSKKKNTSVVKREEKRSFFVDEDDEEEEELGELHIHQGLEQLVWNVLWSLSEMDDWMLKIEEVETTAAQQISDSKFFEERGLEPPKPQMNQDEKDLEEATQGSGQVQTIKEEDDMLKEIPDENETKKENDDDARSDGSEQQDRARTKNRERVKGDLTAAFQVFQKTDDVAPTDTQEAIVSDQARKRWKGLGVIRRFAASVGAAQPPQISEEDVLKLMNQKLRTLDDNGDSTLDVGGVAEMINFGLLQKGRHSTEQENNAVANKMFEMLGRTNSERMTFEEFHNGFKKLFKDLKKTNDKKKSKSLTSSVSSMEHFSRRTALLNRMVLPPDSKVWWVWDWVRFCVCAYYLYMVPVDVAFDESVRDTLGKTRTVLNAVADIFMLLTIISNFFRGVGSRRQYTQIRLLYLLKSFWPDFLGWFPFDMFYSGSRLGRVNKFIHVRFLTWNLDALKDRGDSVSVAGEGKKDKKSESFLGSTFFLIRKVSVLLHLLACFWWLIGTADPILPLQGEFKSWIDGFEGLGIPRGSLSDEGVTFNAQYEVSLYWITAAVTNIGTVGQMLPSNFDEITVVIFFALISLVLTAYIDGSLVGLVIEQDESKVAWRALRTRLETYLQSSSLDKDLGRAIRSHFDVLAQSGGMGSGDGGGGGTGGVFHQMSHNLKQRVGRKLYVKMLSETAVLKNCSTHMLTELAVHCQDVVVTPGNDILRHGEPANLLVWVLSGTVSLWAPGRDTPFAVVSGSRATFDRDGIQPIVPGIDLPFLFDLCYPFSVRTDVDCELCLLQRKDFQEAEKLYWTEKPTLTVNTLKQMDAAWGYVEELDMADDGADAQSKGGSSRTGGRKSSKSSAASSTASSSAGRMSYRKQLEKAKSALETQNKITRQKRTVAFIELAAKGDWPSMEVMLKNKEVEVHEADYDDRTALHLAASNGHLEVVYKLCQGYNAPVMVYDRLKNAPMDDAIRHNHFDVALFLKEFANATSQIPADEEAGLLCSAAATGDISHLKLYLVVGDLDVNTGDYDGRTSLHLAASNGHLDIVKYLCEEFASTINISPLDRLGNTPLDDAIRHDHKAVQDVLIKYGAKLGLSSSAVQMCEAAAANDMETLLRLLNCGVSPNEGDYDDRTPLHLAASNGCLEAATLLLKSNANPNVFDRFLNTPLDDAHRYEQLPMISLLDSFHGVRNTDSSLKSQMKGLRAKRDNAAIEKYEQKIKNAADSCSTFSLDQRLQRLLKDVCGEELIHFLHTCETFRVLTIEMGDKGGAVARKGPSGFSSIGPGGVMFEDWLYELTIEATGFLYKANVDLLQSSCKRLLSILDSEILPMLRSSKEGLFLQRVAKSVKEGIEKLKEVLSIVKNCAPDQVKLLEAAKYNGRLIRILAQKAESLSYESRFQDTARHKTLALKAVLKRIDRAEEKSLGEKVQEAQETFVRVQAEAQEEEAKLKEEMEKFKALSPVQSLSRFSDSVGGKKRSGPHSPVSLSSSDSSLSLGRQATSVINSGQKSNRTDGKILDDFQRKETKDADKEFSAGDEKEEEEEKVVEVEALNNPQTAQKALEQAMSKLQNFVPSLQSVEKEIEESDRISHWDYQHFLTMLSSRGENQDTTAEPEVVEKPALDKILSEKMSPLASPSLASSKGVGEAELFPAFQQFSQVVFDAGQDAGSPQSVVSFRLPSGKGASKTLRPLQLENEEDEIASSAVDIDLDGEAYRELQEDPSSMSHAPSQGSGLPGALRQGRGGDSNTEGTSWDMSRAPSNAATDLPNRREGNGRGAQQ